MPLGRPRKPLGAFGDEGTKMVGFEKLTGSPICGKYSRLHHRHYALLQNFSK